MAFFLCESQHVHGRAVRPVPIIIEIPKTFGACGQQPQHLVGIAAPLVRGLGEKERGWWSSGSLTFWPPRLICKLGARNGVEQALV